MPIRYADVTEADRLWLIRNLAIRHGCQSCYADHLIEAWTPDVTPSGFPSVIEENPFFVAVTEQGDIVATGFLCLETQSVEAIFTLPEYCGRGYASQIVTAIKEEARQRGLSELSLASTPNARHFYEKQGFVVIREATYPLSQSRGELACYEMHCSLS